MALESKKSVPVSDSEWLSACMDGALEADEAQVQIKAIGLDASRRAQWQTYHLIGDVLRSSDLAVQPNDDFMAKLRTALDQEPVVLAPQPAVLAVASRSWARAAARRWRAPAAAVAGVALVAGGLWRMTGPSGGGVEYAVQSAMPKVSASAAVVMEAASSAMLVRDAQLDRYLSAHKQFVGATALGEPSGFVKASLVEANRR